MKNFLVVLFCLPIVIIQSAQAYFDPGTGSLIVQALVGAFATLALFYRQIGEKIKSLLRKKN